VSAVVSGEGGLGVGVGGSSVSLVAG